LLGVTQRELAQAIGVTAQQLHQYETGGSRITAGRLHRLAQALGMEVGYFVQDLEGAWQPGTTERQRVVLDFTRSVAKLSSRRQQEALGQLARALAESDALADMEAEAAQLAAG
jgi:transcriptional regulator with XRE-family HTH domain